MYTLVHVPVHVRCMCGACAVHALHMRVHGRHLRHCVAHVPRAHAQLDRGRRLVAAVLLQGVCRLSALRRIIKVETVALGAVRHVNVQPAVALALGLLLLDPVHILHAEGHRAVPLLPQYHAVVACMRAADHNLHSVLLAWPVMPLLRRVDELVSHGG